MSTDTSEKGLESLIVRAMTGAARPLQEARAFCSVTLRAVRHELSGWRPLRVHNDERDEATTE
jgi:hypothetical protein